MDGKRQGGKPGTGTGTGTGGKAQEQGAPRWTTIRTRKHTQAQVSWTGEGGSRAVVKMLNGKGR